MSVKDQLFTRLQYVLPQHGYSKAVRMAAQIEAPLARDLMIKGFYKAFNPDMDKAELDDPLAYKHLNDFFTRALQDGARPLEGNENSLHSPADGCISECGALNSGKLLQAKGREYSAADLLANESLAAEFTEGSFVTVYLAPHNYHRVHMPMAGRLREMLHVPGKLFSVNRVTANNVPNLFARNERVVTVFDTEHGPMGLVLVGAMGVGHIATTWHGNVEPKSGKQITRWHYPSEGEGCIDIAAGAEMGRFNLGSTAIVLLPKGVAWKVGIGAGADVRVGTELAKVRG